MKTTAQSLDFLTGLLIVLFAYFVTLQFVLPNIFSHTSYVTTVYAQDLLGR